MKEGILDRIRTRDALVGVVGLGYVGLPLSMVFAESGFTVAGFDVDANLVATLNDGRSHIEGVADKSIADRIAQGVFTASNNFDSLVDCDVIIICVPTPLRKTRDPDMAFVIQATQEVASRLRPSQLVVLESTSYPGTTRDLLVPLAEAHGLVVGLDVFLAFSPERVDPGRSDWTTKNTPKVVGGITPSCLDVAVELYESVLDTVVPVSSPEVAELTKIYENTFRSVNIGLANELLLICDRLGLDVWEVIEAAASKPFGFMKFTPGPGLGGHCLPVDPHYLSWKLRGLNYTARFIELASEVNTEMPAFWVRKVQDALNEQGKALNGSTVLVLGIAYKPDVADLRESPSLDILSLLSEKGAALTFHDPLISAVQHNGLELNRVRDLSSALDAADCTILVTDHTAYDIEAISSRANCLVNTRGPGSTLFGHPRIQQEVATAAP